METIEVESEEALCLLVILLINNDPLNQTKNIFNKVYYYEFDTNRLGGVIKYTYITDGSGDICAYFKIKQKQKDYFMEAF